MDTLIRNFLKEHILFKDYANEEFVTLLAKQMKPRMFVDGAYIIRKNEIGKAMFFNLKGQVEVISDDGETVIDVMQDGSFFGEIGVLFSVPRTVSCKSKGKSIILTLTKEALDESLKPYPQIARSIALKAEERYQTHLKKKESSVGEEFAEELNLALTYSDLQEVSIFKEAEIEFLHELTLSLKPVKFYQNQNIIKKGDLANEMYFVMKGTAIVVDETNGTVFAQFQPGSFFGEVGLLLPDNKRTATVRCGSDFVVLFKCEKSAIDRLIQAYPKVKHTIEEEMKRRLEYIRHRERLLVNNEIELATEIETIREKLKSVPIFRGATTAFLHQIALKMKVIRYSPDQTIVKQGDTADSMFFIIDGTVLVTSLDQKVIYAEMSKDSFFGEVSLFYDTNRTASVCSKTECTLVELGKNDLEETLQHYHELKASLLNAASENYVAHCARQNFTFVNSAIGSSIEATTAKLKSIHLFRSCNEGFLRTLALQAKIQSYQADELIFKKGDDSSELYFVNQGSVHIVSSDLTDVFDTVQTGDFVGEVGVLHGCKRTASVKAGESDTVLLVLSISDMERVIQKYPDSLQEIIIASNQRIEKAKSRNDHLDQRSSENSGLLELVQNSIQLKEQPALGAILTEKGMAKRETHEQTKTETRRAVSTDISSQEKVGPPRIKSILDATDYQMSIILSRVPTATLPVLFRVCKKWSNQLYSSLFWRKIDLESFSSRYSLKLLTGLVSIADTHLRELNLTDCWKVNDEALETISKTCSNLNFLSISHCWRVTDTGIAHISSLSKLERLEMKHCSKVRGAGFANHKLANLKHLEISFCGQLSDRNFEKLLYNTPELQYLRMRRCARITDYGIFLIARFCRYIYLRRNINYLDITDCEHFTDRCLKWLSSSCSYLSTLKFSFCKGFTAEGFQQWVGCPQKFTHVDFSYCPNITNSFFKLMKTQLVFLKVLNVRGCPKISDLLAVYLAFHCRQLELIDVRGCPLVNVDALLRIFRSVNQSVVVLSDTDLAARKIIPVGYPGKVRALELALSEVYRVPSLKNAKAKPPMNADVSTAVDSLNVKKFIKAKVKKSMKKQPKTTLSP